MAACYEFDVLVLRVECLALRDAMRTDPILKRDRNLRNVVRHMYSQTCDALTVANRLAHADGSYPPRNGTLPDSSRSPLERATEDLERFLLRHGGKPPARANHIDAATPHEIAAAA